VKKETAVLPRDFILPIRSEHKVNTGLPSN
jgi:hypothetical protein